MVERTEGMSIDRWSAAFAERSMFDAESIPTDVGDSSGSLGGAPAEGTIVSGKYRLDRLIGTGGMGLVYAASHLALQEVVALKILRPSMMAVPGMVSRFMREARAASKIKSEHVARVTDVDTLPNGVPYIVMEYLTGTDLSSLRRRSGKLPIADAVTYIQQACDAISEAHSLGIVHRDLKPSNLFVVRRRDGKSITKVLDFGISKVDSPSEQDTTTTGLTLGTPKYMSPEQMRSLRDTDGRTDIWSLGAILYELLAGRPPFAADSVAQVCALVLEGNLPSLRKLRPEVPLALEAVVARCLRKRPSERFSTADELAQALEPFTTHEVEDELRLSDESFEDEPESRTDTALESLPQMRVSSPDDVTRPTGPLLSRPSRSLPFAPTAPRSSAPPASSQYGASPVSSQYGASPVSSQYGAPPVSSRYGAPPVSSQYGASPVSSQYGASPVSSRYGASPVSSQYGASPVSSQYGASPVSSQYGAPPVSSRYGAPPVSSQYGAPPVSAPSSAPPTPTLMVPQPASSAPSTEPTPALVSSTARPPEPAPQAWRRRVLVAALAGVVITAGAVLLPREASVRIGVMQPPPIDRVAPAEEGARAGSGLGLAVSAGDSAVRGSAALFVPPPVAPAAAGAVPGVEPPTVTPAPSALTIPAVSEGASAPADASAAQRAGNAQRAGSSQGTRASQGASASQAASASRVVSAASVAKPSRVTPTHAPTGSRRPAPATSRRAVVVDPFGGSRK